MKLHLTDPVRFALKATVFVSLVGFIFVVSQSPLAADNDLIPTAIAIDLLITVPVVYFLLIRNTPIPRITVVPVIFACFFLGSTVLPTGLGAVGFVGTVVISAVEIVLLGFVALRIYRTRKALTLGKSKGLDLMENSRRAFELLLKPAALARAVAFEVGVLAYLLFVWRRPSVAGYTYHQRSGARPLLAILLFVIGVETVGVHILLSMWSPAMAWVATALSLYFCIQLTAHFKAITLRPIVLTDTSLMIRCGILGEVSISRSLIKHVSSVEGNGPDSVDLVPLGGMSQPNVQIEVSEPVLVYGVYGIRKEATLIRIFVDEPSEFITAVYTGSIG